MHILRFPTGGRFFFPRNVSDGSPARRSACPAFFFTGLLIGCLLGSYSELFSGRFSAGILSQQPDAALSFRLLLLVALLSTSILGVLLLPVLSAVRGALLGFSAAFYFSAARFQGLLAAAFTVGIPALIGLPAFFLAAEIGTRCSAALIPRFRSAAGDICFLQIFRRVILIFSLAFAEFGYCRWLFPLLPQSIFTVFS